MLTMTIGCFKRENASALVLGLIINSHDSITLRTMQTYKYCSTNMAEKPKLWKTYQISIKDFDALEVVLKLY